jgi:hypothetical protein
MRVVLVNLSDQLFKDSRLRLNASAERFGIKEIRSWDFQEIKQTSFYRENREILDEPRGMGSWLWKPYIILEAMKGLSDDDIVLYCDSGMEFIAPPDPLFDLSSQEQPVVLFGNGNFTNSLWTKRDCFVLMDCDSELFWYGPHCDASFILMRKSALSMKFTEEWLRFACDKRIISDMPNTTGKKDLREFRDHRHDQSILSLMAQKYRLPLYRMPTQYGNHYKAYPYRLNAEFNCVNQYRQQQVNYYAVVPYYNSPYFQLLDHHRSKKGHGVTGKGRTNRLIALSKMILHRLIRR